jgi:DNA-binding transcriptional LysR family regulator
MHYGTKIDAVDACPTGAAMDFRRLTHLVALADKRNFARAAEQVNLTQPALTRSVQAAEAEFGMRLFDRGTVAVKPTPAGEFVLERARRLVFDSRCLTRDVGLYRERALGDTAFGVGPFPAATFLAPLLAGLRREHPGVNLRVEVSNWELLLKRLVDEDIEFFVSDSRDIPRDPGLRIEHLRKEPGSFFVRAGHPLASAGPVELREAWSYGVASVRVPKGVRAALARLLRLEPGSPPPLAIECDDVEILRNVALASDTVLAAPNAAVEREIASGALVALAVEGLEPLFSEMGIVSLRGRTPSPMASAVIARLHALPPTGDPAASRRRADLAPTAPRRRKGASPPRRH